MKPFSQHHNPNNCPECLRAIANYGRERDRARHERDTHGTLLTPQQRASIIAALRHCQGMGHPLPLTEAEIDALCVRLGDQQ
jgi:hypothetical protein